MQNRLRASLLISLIAILVGFVPQTAISDPTTYGPVIEHIRYPTYISPDAQVMAMQREDVEFLTDLIRPMDVETLGQPSEGKLIIGTPHDHFSYIAFNMKNWWLGPIDGSDGPGRALRHAIAHLVPKDELIGTMFKYIVTKIEAPGPPTRANVDPHPYDPSMAHDVLTYDSNWVWDSGDGRWELGKSFAGYSAGEPMPTTTLYSPGFETAPTSWEIMRTTVERMTSAGPFEDEPLPAVHEPIDFNVLLDILDFEPARSLSHDDGGWDAYFGCYSDLGDTARFLFGLFHSSQDIEKGDNQMHLHNTTLDAQLDIINTGLVHSEKVAAAHEAYRLLMGSPDLQYTPTTDGLIARVPIYSRTQYSAIDEGLRGIVNMRLTGSDQSYTFANMYWDNPAGHESDIVNGIDTVQAGHMMKFCNQEPLQTPLNPAYASSPYTWWVMNYLYDTLIRTNPYTLEPFAWMLNETKDPDYPETPGYYVESWGDGMKVTYWMIDDTILWHDGHQIDAFDVEFAWEYQKEYAIGQWWDTFMYFDHADVIDVPYNRTVAAYFTETSQFTPLVLAEMALMFPEHIWGCTHERGGRATPSCDSNWQNAYPGPVLVESGICVCAPGTANVAPLKTTCAHGCGCVIDHPATPQNEVYAYDPSYYAHATPEFPWLTELVASGEFVFKSYSEVAMVSDIIAFDAGRTGAPGCDPNVHYWKTTAELYQILEYLFHRAGDVDYNGHIYDEDQVLYEDAYGYEQGQLGYNPDADLNEDGIVDAEDGDFIYRNYGNYRDYPGVFSLVHVEQQSFSLPSARVSLGGQEFSSSSDTAIFVDPPTVKDDALQPPSAFTVNMSISDVSSLRTWQVKTSWDATLLDVTQITEGDFLKGNPNETVDSHAAYHDTSVVYSSLTHPYGAHDGYNGTYASLDYSEADGRFWVYDFDGDPGGVESQILQVDLNVRYSATASGAGDQYRIVYYGWEGGEITLVDWTSAAAPLATHTWTNPTNPFGGGWTWADLTSMKIAVQTDRVGGDPAAVFDLYEAWFTVTYLRPTIFTYRMNQAQGWCLFSEITLGNYPGVTGNGQLANVEFQVQSYGYSDLNISHPPTKLIRTGRPARISHVTKDGYFSNLYPGDVDGDKYVGSADAGVLAIGYGSWRGDPLYVREADFDDDGYIGSADAGVLATTYGTTYP